jgi:hypothetical protein
MNIIAPWSSYFNSEIILLKKVKLYSEKMSQWKSYQVIFAIITGTPPPSAFLWVAGS